MIRFVDAIDGVLFGTPTMVILQTLSLMTSAGTRYPGVELLISAHSEWIFGLGLAHIRIMWRDHGELAESAHSLSAA